MDLPQIWTLQRLTTGGLDSVTNCLKRQAGYHLLLFSTCWRTARAQALRARQLPATATAVAVVVEVVGTVEVVEAHQEVGPREVVSVATREVDSEVEVEECWVVEAEEEDR